MSEQIWTYVASQAILTGLGAAFVLFLRHRYRATISRTARRQGYQYAMFAMRDETVRLVAESKISETDPHWVILYRFVNDLARTMTMKSVMSAWLAPLYIASLARGLPPSLTELASLKDAPKPLRDIFGKSLVLLVAIMLDGNTVFRWIVRTVMSYSALKQFAVKRIPELARIIELRALSQSFNGSATAKCH